MARERVRIYEERRRLSLWFWIGPLILLLGFLTFFFLRQKLHRARAIVPIDQSSTTLPDLGIVQFDPAKPTLTADGQATLDRAAEAMRGNPNIRLRLDGPADAQKGMRHAVPLSTQRALEATKYLEAHGIDRSRVTVAPIKPSAADIPSQSPNIDGRRLELYAN